MERPTWMVSGESNPDPNATVQSRIILRGISNAYALRNGWIWYSPMDSFVTERVELLRGPNAFLYGETDLGGANNQVTKHGVFTRNFTRAKLMFGGGTDSLANNNLRRAELDLKKARQWSGGLLAKEGADTTHLTVADGMGNVVSTTQTINSLFGARFIVPGLGMIPNDYMSNFDPRPGHALSIAPGKRVTTSMSPMIALRDGKARFALGLPGGRKIFPAALQALLNMIDHGMTLQEAVEAPRIWTEGPFLEVEHGIPETVRNGLEAKGHKLVRMPTVSGGMNGIELNDDGSMTGAACWRADGTPIGLGGGLARAGVRFVLPA